MTFSPTLTTPTVSSSFDASRYFGPVLTGAFAGAVGGRFGGVALAGCIMVTGGTVGRAVVRVAIPGPGVTDPDSSSTSISSNPLSPPAPTPLFFGTVDFPILPALTLSSALTSTISETHVPFSKSTVDTVTVFPDPTLAYSDISSVIL